MKQVGTTLDVETRGRGLLEITDRIDRWIGEQGIDAGLLTVFCRHTSASLTIQENADPDVVADLETFFDKTVPEGPGLYRHSSEGLDDMPAHIKSALTDVSLSIPVMGARTVLGTWQGVFVFEHRRNAHRRQIVLHLTGE